MSHTSNMSRAARKTVEDFRNGAEESKHIVEDVASDLLNTAKKVGAQAKEVVQERWENLRSTASDAVDQGRDKLQEVEHAVEERIQNRPFMSILMAIGFGFLVGFLCRRSR
jgi:ElaB/YqjD/DUF883 family membrane-anchored ribosome-binding protein